MNILEKAEAYDKAVEKLKTCKTNGTAITAEVIENIFPELQKHNENQILKNIIHFLNKEREALTDKRQIENEPDINECIVYAEGLKKRGVTSATPRKHDPKDVSNAIHGFVDSFKNLYQYPTWADMESAAYFGYNLSMEDDIKNPNWRLGHKCDCAHAGCHVNRRYRYCRAKKEDIPYAQCNENCDMYINAPDELKKCLEDPRYFYDKYMKAKRETQMIYWNGNNLKEVIEFTGKSSKFYEFFKTWEEYETYVHEHDNIIKLFGNDGTFYEVPVGSWIVKTSDGYNVPLKPLIKKTESCPTELNARAFMFLRCVKAYSPEVGTDIKTAAAQTISMVKSLDSMVLLNFNDKYIPVDNETTVDEIVSEYFTSCGAPKNN